MIIRALGELGSRNLVIFPKNIKRFCALVSDLANVAPFKQEKITADVQRDFRVY